MNKVISKKLKNQNIHNQERIDSIIINLDGTKQKKLKLVLTQYLLFQWL